MDWRLASDAPPVAEDVLIYSTIHKGYAVGHMNFDRSWMNSTNGMPFMPHTVTHWQPLPDAPVEKPEFRSLKAVSNDNN